MGFVQVQVNNGRATFGTVGKFRQLTADLIPGVLSKKVQGSAQEDYQHPDSLPEEVLKLLKPMAVAAFQRRVCWIWIIGRLRRATQTQNQAFSVLIWSLCSRQGFQCQL